MAETSSSEPTETGVGGSQKERAGIKFRNVVALFLWLGGIHVNAIGTIACLLLLPFPWAVTVICLWTTTIFLPSFNDSAFANNVAGFIAKNAPAHFPMQVHVEDMDAFDPSRSYVFAAEPHSVLPIGIIVLTHHYGLLPFKKIRALATTAVFWTPILRHVWSWLGLVPASRAYFNKLLTSGYSCILIPGGVQECLYLKRGHETIYLRKRFGFLRCAIEAGSPLVPTFCFGQSEVYHYWKPGGAWYAKLSRAVGFIPMMFWGMYGSPVPYPHPMYYVVGKPIEVEKISNPSKEQIAPVQEKFITAMQELFERHKAAAGCPDSTLTIK